MISTTNLSTVSTQLQSQSLRDDSGWERKKKMSVSHSHGCFYGKVTRNRANKRGCNTSQLPYLSVVNFENSQLSATKKKKREKAKDFNCVCCSVDAIVSHICAQRATSCFGVSVVTSPAQVSASLSQKVHFFQTVFTLLK